MVVKNPTFAKKEADSYLALRKRIDLFFKERGLSQKANGAMVAKTAFYLLLLLAAYGNLFSQIPAGWEVLWKYLALGIASALTTMNISHDGLHGAYSSSKRLNRSLGYLMDLCGKSSYHWGKEHVVDHHTFTNIGGHDHNIGSLKRL
jgi:linoleoyl-CoA desaturase